jgi:hypothetical protein
MGGNKKHFFLIFLFTLLKRGEYMSTAKTLAILAILIATIGAVSAAAIIDKTPVSISVNGGPSVAFVQHGNGAWSADVRGNTPVTSAVVTMSDGSKQYWNHKNGAEYASIPYGYNAAVWHWVYTKSGILTISHVTGKCWCPCPLPPC